MVTSQHSQDAEILKPWIDPHQLKCIENIWYKGNWVVITADLNDRRSIIQAHHNPPIHSHPGISKTIQIIKRELLVATNACKDITDYVQGCAECQWHKVNNRPTRHLLDPYIQNQKLCHSKLLHWISLLNSLFHKDTTPSS
jgi:hypothetical protein